MEVAMNTRIYPLTHFAKSMVYSVKLYWNSTKDVFGLLFMLRIFTAHFSPVKCSKTIFRKRAKPLASYRGTIRSGNSIKCHGNAPDTYISSISFLLQVRSLPISIIYQSALTMHPIPWHGGGIAGQMYHVLTFCNVSLVRGKCVAFDIQRQIW